MPAPELWIVAGPNGAGKTSCVQRRPLSELFPRPVHFLNPDDRAKLRLLQAGYTGFADTPPELLVASFQAAADEVYNELCDCVTRCLPVGVETVLSTDKYRQIVDQVRRENGFVGLVYVALSSPDLAVERVARRVQQGGHGVPADKVHQRWHKSLENLPVFASKANAFWVIDNSAPAEEHDAVLMVAHGQAGQLKFLHESCFPELKASLLRIVP